MSTTCSPRGGRWPGAAGTVGRPVSADEPWSSTSRDAAPNPGAASRSYAVQEPTRSADSGTGSSTAGRGAEMRGADGRAATAKESAGGARSEEHTSELQSHVNIVCRLLLEK